LKLQNTYGSSGAEPWLNEAIEAELLRREEDVKATARRANTIAQIAIAIAITSSIITIFGMFI
jgi:hypothetical protein